jgi:hypothetical protein
LFSKFREGRDTTKLGIGWTRRRVETGVDGKECWKRLEREMIVE